MEGCGSRKNLAAPSPTPIPMGCLFFAVPLSLPAQSGLERGAEGSQNVGTPVSGTPMSVGAEMMGHH